MMAGRSNSHRSTGMNSSRPRYIYEIPYMDLLEIHNAMDASGSWRRLAGELNFSMQWVTLVEQGEGKKSPTAALLNEWGHKNATINEFFQILHKLGLYREMERIKPHVKNSLHHLLDNSGPTLTENLPGPPHTSNLNTQPNLPPAESKSWQGPNRDYDLFSEQLPCDKTEENPIDRNEVTPILSGLNVFHFEKIKKATSNFCEQFQLGVGGFSKVYKGWMDGTNFAIKVIAPRDPSTMDQKSLMQHHRNEIEKLTKFRHKNIINLSGYASDGPQFCLVMEYMERGSLEKCLSRDQSKPLSWFTRHGVLKDAACGLEYLHSQNVHCIHGDIKSANILLDTNYVAKLADFGLAKQATTTHNMTSNATGYTQVTRNDINGNEKAFGTLAYLPSDFMTNGAKFSRFTDVFSTGVVICEVLTGRKAYSKREEPEKRFLKDRVKVLLRERCRGGQGQGQDLADIADRNAEGWPGNLWSRLMDLALHCLQDKMRKRPDSKILHEKLTELCKEANKLNNVSKAKKGVSDDDDDHDEKLQTNELWSNSRENQLNVVEDENEDRKQLEAVGTPSLVAQRGSDCMDQHLDDTAVIGDLYGPGQNNTKRYQDVNSEESRWLNYDASKLANDDDDDDVIKKVSNLNAESDDPKFLQYDEKKLSSESSLLYGQNAVPTRENNPKQLFNGLPVGDNVSVASGPDHIPSAEMIHEVTKSLPSAQPKSYQEILTNVPEAIKLEHYYEMEAKLRQQRKNRVKSKPALNVVDNQPLHFQDAQYSSVPTAGADKVQFKEELSLPNMNVEIPESPNSATIFAFKGDSQNSTSDLDCAPFNETAEFREKVDKLSINVNDNLEDGDIDTSELEGLGGGNMKFL